MKKGPPPVRSGFPEIFRTYGAELADSFCLSDSVGVAPKEGAARVSVELVAAGEMSAVDLRNAAAYAFLT